MQIKERDI